MLEGIYEEQIYCCVLHKVLDQVTSSLNKLDIENMWQSLFSDHIVTLTVSLRETIDKNPTAIGEEIQDKIWYIYQTWAQKQDHFLSQEKEEREDEFFGTSQTHDLFKIISSLLEKLKGILIKKLLDLTPNLESILKATVRT